MPGRTLIYENTHTHRHRLRCFTVLRRALALTTPRKSKAIAERPLCRDFKKSDLSERPPGKWRSPGLIHKEDPGQGLVKVIRGEFAPQIWQLLDFLRSLLGGLGLKTTSQKKSGLDGSSRGCREFLHFMQHIMPYQSGLLVGVLLHIFVQIGSCLTCYPKDL